VAEVLIDGVVVHPLSERDTEDAEAEGREDPRPGGVDRHRPSRIAASSPATNERFPSSRKVSGEEAAPDDDSGCSGGGGGRGGGGAGFPVPEVGLAIVRRRRRRSAH
jgi:hypothetical protein